MRLLFYNKQFDFYNSMIVKFKNTIYNKCLLFFNKLTL